MLKYFIHPITLIIFLFSGGFFLWFGSTEIVYKNVDINISKALQAKVDTVYIDKHIREALENKNFEDVLMYQNLAKLLNISLAIELQDVIARENSFLKKSWRNIADFGSGFLSGKADTAVGIGGSIVSDMTLYGDLRDLKTEGTKYKNGESYDKFILQLSLVGIGLSATQLLSAGASSPLKVGASVIKTAKKSGNLTKSFSKSISKRLSKTIDMKLLKTYNPKIIAKNINLVPVKELFKEINGIKKHTSMLDAIAILKYVDTNNDLRKIAKISKAYKSNTKGVLKVLGKGVLRAGKSVLKITTKLIVGVIGFILSILGFIVGVLTKWFACRRIKRSVF